MMKKILFLLTIVVGIISHISSCKPTEEAPIYDNQAKIGEGLIVFTSIKAEKFNDGYRMVFR